MNTNEFEISKQHSDGYYCSLSNCRSPWHSMENSLPTKCLKGTVIYVLEKFWRKCAICRCWFYFSFKMKIFTEFLMIVLRKSNVILGLDFSFKPIFHRIAHSVYQTWLVLAYEREKCTYFVELICHFFLHLLFIFLPSPCVKNVTVTLILSSKANVSNGCSMGADFVNTTRCGMICPSITFLSMSSGRGCGCNLREFQHEIIIHHLLISHCVHWVHCVRYTLHHKLVLFPK